MTHLGFQIKMSFISLVLVSKCMSLETKLKLNRDPCNGFMSFSLKSTCVFMIEDLNSSKSMLDSQFNLKSPGFAKLNIQFTNLFLLI